MEKLMIKITKSPILSILFAVVFTFMFVSGFNDLFLDSSTKSLLTQNDPHVEYLKVIKDEFGDAVIQSIIFKSDTIFRKKILQKIIDTTYEAQSIEGVNRVVSMSTVINLKNTDEGLNTSLLLDTLPKNQEEMDILKQDTLSNTMFIGEVVNAAGTVAGIHLFLDNTDNEADFDNRILNDIDILIQKAKKELPGDVEIYHIGTPRLRADMITAMNHDAIFMVPLAGFFVSVVLFLFLRTGLAVFLPMITGTLSIAATLGFMGVMGYGINPVTVIIPTLLYVMGSTEDIHLLSEYLHGLENKETKNIAILNMLIKCATAITLTALTTFLGFATIIANSTPILREFGIAASFGIAANFIITILTVPALLNYYKAPRIRIRKETRPVQYFREFVFSCITRYRHIVIGILVFLITGSLWGIFKVYIETDYVKFFQKDADVPVLLDKLDHDLSGGTNFMVVVESKETEAFQNHKILNNIARLQDYLNDHHGKAVGYVDMIRKIHQEINDGKKTFFTLPDQENAIAQYNLLLDNDNLYRFINSDFNRISILVRSRISGTQEILAAYKDIMQFAKENLSQDLSYHITGEIILVAKASNDMTREILQSLGIMFLAIFIVSSALFLSLKAGALAMIPNILPVLVLFGFMGIMNIPISVATFPVAIIALGIAVDDTIHFMIRYAHELKKTGINDTAIKNAVQMEIRPILATSTALIAGFLMLMFGEFGSTIQFGKLTALCLFTALISDLLITPILFIQIPIISPIDLLQSYIGKKLTYSKCELLKGLKKGEVRRVLTMGNKKMISSGQQFITQGDRSFNMVLILEGRVDVVQEETCELLATLHTGDVAGEMSFLTNEPRSASVIARCETEIFEIDNKLIQLVSRRFPRVGNKLFFNISRILSERLKKSNLRSPTQTAG